MGVLARSVAALVATLGILHYANGAVLPNGFLVNKNGSESGSSSDHESLELFRSMRASSLFGQLDENVQGSFLGQMVFPAYLDRFFNEFRYLPDFEKLIAKLVDGVEDINCKSHVIEWVVRVATKKIPELATEREKWVLHSTGIFTKKYFLL